jgi:hypothetical protein
MRSFENDKFKVSEWLLSDVCESGLQHMRHRHYECSVKARGKRNTKVKKKEKALHMSALAWSDTLLDYMHQRGFKYSDITAAKTICNTM